MKKTKKLLSIALAALILFGLVSTGASAAEEKTILSFLPMRMLSGKAKMPGVHIRAHFIPIPPTAMLMKVSM